MNTTTSTSLRSLVEPFLVPAAPGHDHNIIATSEVIFPEGSLGRCHEWECGETTRIAGRGPR